MCYNVPAMSRPKIELLLPPDYLKTATKAINKAERRVCLICLTMYRDKVTNHFIDALVDAAKRGVDVHVAADFASFSLAVEHGSAIKSAVREFRDGTGLSREFRSAGATFRWLGRNYGTLFSARTHSKWLVVDDTVFMFGGVNTDDDAVKKYNDYMFRIDDPQLADLVEKEHRNVERADRTKRLTRNHRETSSVGTVLFDNGHPLWSIIYNTVVKLTKDPEVDHMLFVSQYSPSGLLARAIRKRSGVDTGFAQIYFNPIEKVDSPSNQFMLHLGSNDLREKNLYKRDQYLHAKFIIFTYNDGHQVAITGSHNFVEASSRIGTREVALLTENRDIIRALEKFFHDKVQ